MKKVSFLFLFFISLPLFPQAYQNQPHKPHSKISAEQLEEIIAKLTDDNKVRPDTLFDKVLRQGELSTLIAEVPNRWDLQLERLAAYFFHQLINEYRLEKGRTTLYWDERMWLAARNHNVYMAKTKYGHEEKNGAVGFTGIQPWDRIQFVTYNGFKMSIYAENILMNYSAMYRRSLVDNAKNIADESFEMWKSSPPHNKNMLNPEFFAHGTSFYSRNNGVSQIFGTTNFGNASDFVIQEISISWNDSLAKCFPPKAEDNRKPIKPSNWSAKQAEKELLQVLKSKMPKYNSAYIPDFSLAAAQGIKNKMDANVRDYKLTSAKQRFLKIATESKTKFLLVKMHENAFSFDFSIDQLTNKSALKVIDERISKELPPLTDIAYWGADCKLSENGSHFQCIIDVVYVHK